MAGFTVHSSQIIVIGEWGIRAGTILLVPLNVTTEYWHLAPDREMTNTVATGYPVCIYRYGVS